MKQKLRRPRGECYDCGRKYGGMGWMDFFIPDAIWDVIRPMPEQLPQEAGILCLCCAAKRLDERSIKDVDLLITSGPFKVVLKSVKAKVGR